MTVLGVILVLAVVGGLHWYLVFDEGARRKLAKPGWSFWKRSRKGRELDDAFNMATALIVAVVCSTMIVAVSIVALIVWLK